jgi:tetratricopeptide (TPR) repeat protein
MRPGMGSGVNDEQVYPVPWRLIKPGDAPVKEGLVVYWFPSSNEEVRRSSLLNSRILSLYASQCVTMGIADWGGPMGQKLAAGEKLPVVVLAEPDGTIVSKAENKNGYLRVEQVEKLVANEVKRRESALKEKIAGAKEKAKTGDAQAAIQELRGVLEQKCLFPKYSKDAARELKKLGVSDVGRLFDAPVYETAASVRIERTMRDALRAENDARYLDAKRLYEKAHRMDPADPTPLRYLGELYRHHTGEWEKAAAVFDRILDMPADPLSRAVALHGLGKMTIHDGEFKKGLALMERAAQEYPLALTYRNLAVYWNSEGDAAKTSNFVELALAADPADPFNLIFAAVFKAASGRTEEALKIAREHESLLAASYNLAAIYALAGQRDRALELLKRHFFEYERYQAVRAKEMMEARVDAVFHSIRQDPEFMALTSGADGKLPMPGMSAPSQQQ